MSSSHSLYGQGLGRELLHDVYECVAASTAVVGARPLVADAIDEETARFYEHFGITRLPGENSMPLVREISDI